MDWSANHWSPIAQQSAKIVTARATQRITPKRVVSDFPVVNQLVKALLRLSAMISQYFIENDDGQ
jgi:hypothetical protein